MDSSTFYIKDCALAVIATGIKAQSLIDLRDKLSSAHPASIYHHFWGGRLSTSFERREFHNDFSSWAHKSLHDDILAERLELLNPHEFVSLEDLSQELQEIIDTRIDEREVLPMVKSEQEFHFIKSKIVVFQTRHQINEPKELVTILPLLTPSTIFYHVIDASRRLANKSDDFSYWLQNFQGYEELISNLRKIDPYFISLSDLRKKLLTVVSDYFSGESKHG